MMQDEVVTKRKWIDEQHFLDMTGATNLIPGPNSTEMAIHNGYEKAGWKGLIIAGLCFILLAVLITGFFAWLYKQYGQLPEFQPFIYGIKPANCHNPICCISFGKKIAEIHRISYSRRSGFSRLIAHYQRDTPDVWSGIADVALYEHPELKNRSIYSAFCRCRCCKLLKQRL